MRLVKTGKAAAAVLIALVIAILAWAWVNGGREPLRPIVVPVAVPESAR